ncbi:hypothetical protein PV394_28555 [Streptomyces sp. NE06-03E]|uniref:Zinc ribbon domain-containing protein n=1 Tax=Streptomyces silvae TaxID=2803812 RepID=A0ABU8A019_9ACTN|nr:MULTISPECIES: hypothetical protein [unclassified Streptomyces]WSS61680.1 hypothetical protein OG284_10785 [Streptomyces sp. NBC_01177]MDX3059046.1 hypothetical protein [Streptomyces sp. NE06-03E]MDX3324022.1 hypothetical protein [Streptomyces sp. ME02-6979-3A]MDX3430376.1 hypothetical protein [Streptomyces sp. ME01-18a]MDX3686307.1 hypothetical protein [Streptomyces sp. AK04-4c]
MDYCHPCQRHLNGALACAGCGTPADALVPYAVTGASGLSAEPAAETLEASGSAGHRRRGRGDARRRGRRAHRRRGRALLLTATGVVLALGALSLAELAMEPDGDSGAAEYVSEATSSATEPLPSASSAEHDDPGPVEEPTVVPVTDSHSATATDGPAGATTAPGALPSPSGPADTTPSAPESSSAPEDPDGTDAPAEPSGSGKPTTDPEPPEPTEEPTPSPSPTETCHWIIFCF